MTKEEEALILIQGEKIRMIMAVALNCKSKENIINQAVDFFAHLNLSEEDGKTLANGMFDSITEADISRAKAVIDKTANQIWEKNIH